MGTSQIWNKKVLDRIFKATSLKHKKRKNLEKLENNTNYIENLEYIVCRNKLDEIYEQKINGTRIRSKCNWYE